MGCYFRGLVLGPFLKISLTFKILKLLGNELSLIKRLHNSHIHLPKTSAPSFRNLPEKLSIPVALDGLKPFNNLFFFQDIFQYIRVQTKCIAIVRCNLFFHSHNAKEILFYIFHKTQPGFISGHFWYWITTVKTQSLSFKTESCATKLFNPNTLNNVSL